MKPTIPWAAPYVRAVYTRSPNGCCFYTVLENGNYELCFVEGCMVAARDHGHHDCVELGTLLLEMSNTQRKQLSRMRHSPDEKYLWPWWAHTPKGLR